MTTILFPLLLGAAASAVIGLARVWRAVPRCNDDFGLV